MGGPGSGPRFRGGRNPIKRRGCRQRYARSLKGKAAAKKYRKSERYKMYRRAYRKTPKGAESVLRQDRSLSKLVYMARDRSKKNGWDTDITVDEIFWPTHCPVFPRLKLDYSFTGKAHSDNRPSLDRLDNSKGYTLDNVVVISMKANRLKSNATADELERLTHYTRYGFA